MMNSDKTQLLWLGTRQQLNKLRERATAAGRQSQLLRVREM